MAPPIKSLEFAKQILTKSLHAVAEGWNGSGVRGDKQPLISVVYPENLVREHVEVSTETSFRGQKGPVLYEPDGLIAPTALRPGVEE